MLFHLRNCHLWGNGPYQATLHPSATDIIHYTAHAEDKKLEKLLRVFFLVGKSHMNRIKLNHFLPSVRFAGGFSVPLEIP